MWLMVYMDLLGVGHSTLMCIIKCENGLTKRFITKASLHIALQQDQGKAMHVHVCLNVSFF